MEAEEKHLLFVDDEPPILEMYGRMLHSESGTWRLHFAQGVEEALRETLKNDMDVIVTDVKMPGKDGFDLLRLLRSSTRTCDIPTIVVTGTGDPELKCRALDLGASDLLDKPVSREDIVARIRNAIRLKTYQDRLKIQVETLDSAVKERTIELEHSQQEIVWRLAKAGEYRDDETGNHVMRVACYSCAIGKALGAAPKFIEDLFLSSALHDVGKIGIPDSLLLKSGPFTKIERQDMQKHTVIGAGILMHEPLGFDMCQKLGYGNLSSVRNGLSSPLLALAGGIAKYHHEKWDGSGYPEGLSKTGIPMEARIVALADVYDALMSERRYKPAFSREQSLEIVHEESGRHFDPQVVAAFDRIQDEAAAIGIKLGDSELCVSL